mgnify:CR=1 FL=1
MAYLKQDNLQLHYTDHGSEKKGEAIITLHGLSESGLYWTLPGITDGLVAAGYRVINMDMRAHGRTRVSGDDKGYDVEVIAGDIERLADSLDLEKFHLLTHATGGMVGFRYAMKNSDRLLSVMATNTGSATLPSDEGAALTDPSIELPKVDMTQLELGQQMIAGFRGLDWETIMAGVRATATEHIYLNAMHKAVNPESAFAMFEACVANGNPDEIADFLAAFYGDPDPKIAGLRQISCPCLMLEGEHDVQFIKPAELVAREVPSCTHVVLDDMGHMLAFENPQKLLDVLLGFLRGLV